MIYYFKEVDDQINNSNHREILLLLLLLLQLLVVVQVPHFLDHGTTSERPTFINSWRKENASNSNNVNLNS